MPRAALLVMCALAVSPSVGQNFAGQLGNGNTNASAVATPILLPP